jgi:hypothetical protein
MRAAMLLLAMRSIVRETHRWSMLPWDEEIPRRKILNPHGEAV